MIRLESRSRGFKAHYGHLHSYKLSQLICENMIFSLQKAQVSNAPPKKYRLLGIVSHMGDSSDTGHYISDVFDCKGKEWKSYNDSAVKKVRETCIGQSYSCWLLVIHVFSFETGTLRSFSFHLYHPLYNSHTTQYYEASS